MAIEVVTKDCTALTESEIAEMVELCIDGPSFYDLETIQNQVASWVLITTAHEGEHLRGFSFFSLERIGGTPCILFGCVSIRRNSKREQVLRAILNDQYRRGVISFPDEDVVVGTRFTNVGGFDCFKALNDIIPRPGYTATGEERAWGRRLAKRFRVPTANYNDRTFIAKGDATYPLCFDYEALKPEKCDQAVAAQFDEIDVENGDTLIAHGWAMAEFLAKFSES